MLIMLFWILISVVFYITTSVGLYLINKKLGEKHAWIAFIPVIKIYSYIKASGIPFWKNFIRMIITMFVVLIIAFFIQSVIQFSFSEAHAVSFGDTARTDSYQIDESQSYGGNLLSSIVFFLAFYIPLLLFVIKIYHGISKRCGRGVWTTVGFFFIPYIMFLVVGLKLKDQNSNQTTDKVIEKKEENSTEL
ncbi:MAG: hypothetical protein GY828_01670 [Candidatus Gracilibacteria bacterium]|nr:hypothetical protein [Candidatus Gracilibacteria bacterium]